MLPSCKSRIVKPRQRPSINLKTPSLQFTIQTYLLTPFCGLNISRCSTFTCISTSDPVTNSRSQIGHWNVEPWGPGETAIALDRVLFSSVRVALVKVIVGFVSPRVGFSEFAFVLASPRTEGDVRSKWALFMCSSNFLGHVDVKLHRRHWNIF